MPLITTEFGYYPQALQVRVGHIRIDPLPDIAELVAGMETSEGVENGWIYAPPQQVRNLGGGIRTMPYSCRVFGLPKTHVIEHAAADNDDHVTFLLWALSFFTGMRLTATEAGFVDATPINPHKLVDFILSGGGGLDRALEIADAFWIANRADPERARLWSAAVHALFLGQNPRLLQYEEFVHLYMALDACFALCESLHSPGRRIFHVNRIEWMCGVFGMPVPTWGNPNAPGGAEVAALRNDTVHEALFVGQPLGFAVHGVGTNHNITLEMEALICRLLVALIGGPLDGYVRSSTETRQIHGLSLR